MAREVARNWFVPGDGIDRHVISADIQRYLGNDATVRPGRGTGKDEGVDGYWIKAYRNLTTAMISDLRADSTRWRQEQRQTGTREPYEVSRTYYESNASSGSGASRSGRRSGGGDSPVVEGPYQAPGRERIPAGRVPIADRMDIDPPVASPPDRRHPDQRAYQPDPRAYPPPDSRAYPQDRNTYQREQPMASVYGQPPVSSAYGQEPRYAPSYPSGSDGAPPGYVRQGQYYVPIPGYEQPPAIPPSRSEPVQYGSGPYGQPQPPQGRELRDQREPRYGGQPEYQDPRFAYPSPAATVSSISQGREAITSPPQQSLYGSIPPSQYDRYGQPVPPGYPPGQQERVVQTTREPSNYTRERLPGSTGSGDSRDTRDTRDSRDTQRRRIR